MLVCCIPPPPNNTYKHMQGIQTKKSKRIQSKNRTISPAAHRPSAVAYSRSHPGWTENESGSDSPQHMRADSTLHGHSPCLEKNSALGRRKGGSGVAVDVSAMLSPTPTETREREAERWNGGLRQIMKINSKTGDSRKEKSTLPHGDGNCKETERKRGASGTARQDS
jgi:hypothetical protein